MTGNTSKQCGGAAFNKSYRDLVTEVYDRKPAQTKEEIISRLKAKLQKYGEQG